MRGLNSSPSQIISLQIKKYSNFQGIIITVPVRFLSKFLQKQFCYVIAFTA